MHPVAQVHQLRIPFAQADVRFHVNSIWLLAVRLLRASPARPPNEVSCAQRRHKVESLRTVARYVRWLCIGQLGVHQVVKELRGFRCWACVAWLEIEYVLMVH